MSLVVLKVECVDDDALLHGNKGEAKKGVACSRDFWCLKLKVELGSRFNSLSLG